MGGEGYAIFHGIECIYVIGTDEIRLIPKNPDDIRKLNCHFDDRNFYFHYSDSVDKNQVAYIKKVKMNIGHSLSLIPLYSVKLFKKAPVSSIEMTGPVIDEFFSPAGYFYNKHISGNKTNVDLTREIEFADRWEIIVDEVRISISLLYGGILRRGIASDLILHPMLHVDFPGTEEPNFYFKVYSILIRFLQFVQYNGILRQHKVYLRGTASDYTSGYLYDWSIQKKDNSRLYTECEYQQFKPYIQSLLQFIADNSNMSLDFLPIAQYRHNSSDYTPALLTTLFAAFENEYKINYKIYNLPNSTDIGYIKSNVIKKIRECNTGVLTEAEAVFLKQAEDRINSLGTQTGQTRKIKNVYHVIEPAIKRSAEHLFIRSALGTADGFSEKEINQIAGKIVALRSQAAHEHSILSFSEEQAEYIHFLEILVYAQMLKRAGIDNTGIELLIGVVFHCNFVFMEQKDNNE